MKLAITPLHSLFVAKITDIELSKPIDENAQQAIGRAMDAYAVCVFPRQHLDDEHQVAFSRLYGPLEVSPHIGSKSSTAAVNRRIEQREIFDVSNLDQNGSMLDEKHVR